MRRVRLPAVLSVLASLCSLSPIAAAASPPDSARARVSFASEFGGAYRLGPEIKIASGHPEERATAIWDFGPVVRLSDSHSIGILPHVSYAGPDNPRAGILARWSYGFASRTSLDLSYGWLPFERGRHGGFTKSALAMATVNFHDVWLPTVMVQFPDGEPYGDPRVFPALKVGSAPGLVMGLAVPAAVFAVAAVLLSSAW